MTLLIEQLLAGLSIGLLYGLLGVALSTATEASGVLNLSQGSLATLSAYIEWQLLHMGLEFWLALAVTLVFSFLVGMLVEQAFIRPVQGAPEMTILAVTAALFLGLTALTGIVWGYNSKSMAGPFGTGTLHLGRAVLTDQQVGTAVVGIAATAIVWFILSRTGLGLKMRATAMNRQSASYLGISGGRMRGIGWGLAAAMGAIAGIFMAPVTQLSPDMMDSAILMSFAALILGGAGSFGGVVLGGIFVGVVTDLGFTYVPFVSGRISDFVPFVLIVIVLLVRPRGLFGRVTAARS